MLAKPMLTALLLTGLASAQTHVFFPTQDGGLIYGDLHGKGGRCVVLADGGRFNKESWENQARELAEAGFRVLASIFAVTARRAVQAKPTL
jgi:hypothetical protein